MSDKLKIIGIGSPNGDDRLGWTVIERLSERLGERKDVELIALDRPGVGLIDYLAGETECWLVDAVKSERKAPGCYLQPGLDQLLQAGSATTGSHGVGLAEALNLAGTLGLLPQRLELHGITIGTTNIVGQDLSLAVNTGVNRLVERFLERLEKNLVHTATFNGGVGSLGSSSGSSD
ncbi:hydrogenase maturation protease [Marinobacterium lutimaris]|uniref:Hydrogenase maturation protease n=1 Tax=Marinobacterium lutimaris TaxID=568106 RepID=A0A1H6AM75_9GAMM|nr:hydrogenase maturation protease [Marinobacterium lutimaris]SEG49502.1 hydrogenase maturation protease [Marinobacterium lutimaris]